MNKINLDPPAWAIKLTLAIKLGWGLIALLSFLYFVFVNHESGLVLLVTIAVTKSILQLQLEGIYAYHSWLLLDKNKELGE